MEPLLFTLCLRFAIGAVLFIALKYYIKTLRYSRMGNRMPGPETIPLLGNVKQLVDYNFDYMKMVRKLQEVYNEGLFRLWYGPVLSVIITHPDHVRTFCTSLDLLDHSFFYHFLDPVVGHALFTASGDTWKRSRKRVVRAFTATPQENLVKVFQEEALTLVSVLKQHASQGEFESYKYLRNCTANTILRTTMQMQMNFQTESPDVIDHIDKIMEIAGGRVTKVWQHSSWLFDMTPTGKEFHTSVKALHSFCEPIVQKHWRIIKGYDTTAATLGYALLMLGQNLDVQERVYQELADLDKKLAGKEVELADLSDLKYLEMVIKETLRLFPIAPIIARTTDIDISFGKYTAPPQSDVACAILCLHRDPSLYQNPLEFNPDNFLPDRVAERHPYSFIPFSHGARMCVGVKYAYNSLKVLLSTILRDYIVRTKPCSIEELTDRMSVNFTAKDNANFPIQLQLRLKRNGGEEK